MPTVVFAMLAVAILASAAPSFWIALTDDPGGHRGTDFNLYMTATRSWLSGLGFYHPYQLSGPYEITPGDILYPPLALWLFVPFVFLPAALWWVVPIGIGTLSVIVHRPVVLVWPLLALALAWQPVEIRLLSGNPVIWSYAALGLATLSGGWAVLVLLKPALAPFAAWGMRRRSWWLALGALSFGSILLAPMWPDWIRVMLNSRNPSGLLYAWQEIPLLLIPLVAWWGSTRRLARRTVPGDDQPATVVTSRGQTARAPSS